MPSDYLLILIEPNYFTTNQKEMKKLLPVCLLFCFFLSSALAQKAGDFEDLEAVGKKGFFKTYFTDLFKDFSDFGNAFDLGGGVSLNMRSYSALGTAPRQDPFFYSLGANANVRIHQLNIPFSLMISAKNKDVAYPDPKEFIDAFKNNAEAQKNRFVRFGFSPRYKFIKLHFGHRSMNFSQFTLSNLNFLGAGAEINPGKLRFAAMYGRLARAEPVDLSLNTPNLPVFLRKGYGFKLGYGTTENFIDIMLFSAKDDPNSIFIPAESEMQASPQANQVLGLTLQKVFFERIRFKVDGGASALSPNSLDERTNAAFPHFGFKARNTSTYKKAIESSLDFEAKLFTAGVKYKRIDPNFKSFGAFFFNSDIEDYTANLNFSMFGGSLTNMLSAGIQRNNINDELPNRLTRFIGSAGINYSKDALNLALNYSNNSSDVSYLADLETDSLNVIIVTQDAGFNASYSIADSSMNNHVFNLSTNLQMVTDDINDPTASSASQMLVTNFIYNLTLPSKWGFSMRANYNRNEVTQLRMRRFGAGAGVMKQFFEGKLSLGTDFNWFLTTLSGIPGSNHHLNAQARVNWKVSDSHAIVMNWNFLNTRKTAAGVSDQFGEVVGTLGYQYMFTPMKKNKDGGNDKKTKRKKDKSPETKKDQ